MAKKFLKPKLVNPHAIDIPLLNGERLGEILDADVGLRSQIVEIIAPPDSDRDSHDHVMIIIEPEGKTPFTRLNDVGAKVTAEVVRGMGWAVIKNAAGEWDTSVMSDAALYTERGKRLFVPGDCFGFAAGRGDYLVIRNEHEPDYLHFDEEQIGRLADDFVDYILRCEVVQDLAAA